MARKRSRRSKPSAAKRPRTRRPAKSTRKATGPVTLAEARALATVASPAQRAAPVAKEPAYPANGGRERRKLESKQKAERQRRIKEYKATLAIMKKRGVKGLQPKGGEGVRAQKAAVGPLQVFAEGDSWFEYPIPFFGGG